MRTLALSVLALLASCASPHAAGAHADPVQPLLLLLVTVLVAAKLGGELATRLGQPSVLGELLAGVLLAVGHHAGLPLPDLESSAALDVLARLGVVVLLFEVGLESTVPQLLSVGARATVVAVVGVIAPIAGGFLVGGLLLPEAPWSKPLFLGAALCATSVGITARVFKDLGTAQTPEARLIVGAAVIDDVLGLVVLSVVSGVAVATAGGGSLDWRVPAASAGFAAAFLAGAILLGPVTSRLVFRASQRLRSPGILLPLALALAFVFAYVAGAVQLAPIVGAYAAGLILERAHYQTLLDRGEHELEELVKPISQFLVPVFFVLMGARVHVWEFTGARVWMLAVALIVVAFVTKLACALAAPRGSNRLLVGVGMVPRGEVGLIFADAGRTLVVNGQPLLDGTDFSSIVMMVAATTLLTPPLLARLARRPASEPAS
jgi:Kef-type K+ transport system membrane component KefB